MAEIAAQRYPAPRRTGAAAAERGSTTIPERVVTKIAARAASQVPGVGEVGRGIGRLFGAGSGPVRVAVRLSGREAERTAIIRLGIAVRYPRPAATTARRVREHVADTVERLTGIRVGRVDIEVVELPHASAAGERAESR
ncbi:putative alkaline shock family protein YloU [Nocardiopsis mwathae]|uniref:Putative alkaline shock family protein YloU n=1 Tax=Nocardiopsis mwathae TaxID=1472723 RepID=A0A7X0D8M3_9ACTN|nr:Asp23/Gls24 family envelope stress response protein [Nocardiopsis mwathae]MBB6174891.1 putative alkaline shock family protein YloU [Nocardiopsis mwathae]